MIKTPIQFIHDICRQAFVDAYPEHPEIDPIIRPTSKEIFGDYQCNGAIKLANSLGISPIKAADTIVEKLDKAIFQSVSIAKSGFINLILSEDYLCKTLSKLPNYLIQGALIPAPQTIVVEYSSPNIAKDMHVGHLRSTVIGDALARMLIFLGHTVVKLNHLGDWGTSFGILITYMKAHPERKSDSIADLTALYKAAKITFDESDSFKEDARKNVVALQAGDQENLKLWQDIYRISRQSFAEIYSLLDVEIQERGESFYNPSLNELIQELEEKQLITISDGAKCIFIDTLPIPLIVQKSDGGFNYDTTDMAAMRQRALDEKASRIIIVTDAGQALHFKLIKAASEKAGYLSEQIRFDHVCFGLVLDAQGKKFKTRSGDSIKLLDLLHIAVEEAAKLIKDKNPDLPEAEVKQTSKILGINAVKYADLLCNRIHDYVFSFEKMLRFEGKTATFILYSYVRIQGIKRKLHIDNSTLNQIGKDHPFVFSSPEERSLALHLIRFPEILLKTVEDLFPNYLADYLYELAEKFNIFFKKCRIDGSDYKFSRLNLCYLTETVLKTGMSLLGLQTVNRL
ncbi:MAG: arginine--tRNA ligase [Victivallaceae bacterium]